jgi:hypothetical protein
MRQRHSPSEPPFIDGSEKRSDCSKGRPRLVFVVAKKVRAGLKTPSGRALRAGLAIIRGPFLSVTVRHS